MGGTGWDGLLFGGAELAFCGGEGPLKFIPGGGVKLVWGPLGPGGENGGPDMPPGGPLGGKGGAPEREVGWTVREI